MTTAPPGWHPDPNDPDLQRYWDGEGWTTQTRSAATNPILPIAPPTTLRATSETHAAPAAGTTPAPRRRDGVISRTAVMATPGDDASAVLLVTPLEPDSGSADFVMGYIPDIPVTPRSRSQHTWWWMIGLYLVILAAAVAWWRGSSATTDLDPIADVPRVVSARPVAPYLVGAQPLIVGSETSRTSTLVPLVNATAVAPQFAADYGPEPYQWGRTLTVLATTLAAPAPAGSSPVDLAAALSETVQATATGTDVPVEEPGFVGQQWCREGTRGSDFATACAWTDGDTVVLMVIGLPLIEAAVPMERVLQSLSRPESGADAVAPDDDATAEPSSPAPSTTESAP